MKPAIDLESVAVSVPRLVLTNDHWCDHHPEAVVAGTRWSPPGSEAFRHAIALYAADPFRGARERRVLEPEGSALELEASAARRALQAAGLGVEEIDLLICTSFPSDEHGIGGATFLARELGLAGTAWNLEAASASAVVALQTACSLIAAGKQQRALVVTSCTFSRVAPSDEIGSWGVGDGASAMVVGPVEDGAGLLGSHTVNSAEADRAAAFDLSLGEDREPRMRLRVDPVRLPPADAEERHLLECCH